MARTKRRDLSRPPPPAPPPPPLHDSSEDEDDKVDLEAPAAAAAPPNPTDDDGAEDADVQAFQVRPALRSPTNRQSDADDHQPAANLEPAPKDAAAKKKKKRRAPTAKARVSHSTEVEVVVGLPAAAEPQNPNHDSTDVHHDADGGGEPEPEPDDDPAKPASKKRPAPTGKATKTRKNSNGKKAAKRQRVEPEPAPSSGKPGKRVWTADDEIKILEAIVAHVKRHGAQPRTGDLLATVGDTLQRKNCNYTEIYEKVRGLNKRYEKVTEKGELSVKGDELRMYKLSLAIWGQKNAGDVVSDSTSQDNGVPSESNKDQVDGDGDGNGDGGGGGGGDGESIIPKEGTDTNVQGRRREFVELQSLYPCLASYVERITAQHPCAAALKRAFELISDKKACALEPKIKKQKIAEVKMEIRAADIRKEVANVFL